MPKCSNLNEQIKILNAINKICILQHFKSFKTHYFKAEMVFRFGKKQNGRKLMKYKNWY